MKYIRQKSKKGIQITLLGLIPLLSTCVVPARQPVRPVVRVVIPDYTNLARQVEITRTDYGVPHIQGGNLKAMAFGMAWCQMEDYGARVAESLVAARGIAAKVFENPELIESDFWRKRSYNRAVETYHQLHQDTRDVLEGFAAGVTAYIKFHPEEFAEWPFLVFTGHDVSALTTGGPNWGGWDVAWGEVHRVRRGEVDVPVGGGSGGLGCFRVLSFGTAEDGKLVANRGDGWVLAVEFSNPPRAYSILAYGQSSQEDSPHFDDQAEMFARNEMKRVAFTPQEIREHSIRRYKPELRPDRRD